VQNAVKFKSQYSIYNVVIIVLFPAGFVVVHRQTSGTKKKC